MNKNKKNKKKKKQESTKSRSRRKSFFAKINVNSEPEAYIETI